MYDYDYDYYGSSDALAGGMVVVIYLIALVIGIATIIGMWRLFKKAGYNGWEAIVPFYNTYVLCDLVFGNGLYFLISFIPYVNVVFVYVLYFKLASVFNKDIGYGLGLIFLTPIFIIMLAYDGNAYYSGPSVKARAMGGGYGNYGNYGGGSYSPNANYNNNDYQTYGGNNQQGYPNPTQQQDIYQSGNYQNNGFQNNGFQAQGQSQPQQQSNPFEKQDGNNYYGNNNNYNNYNSYNNQNNNGGF